MSASTSDAPPRVTTTEVRWFGHGDAPSDVRRWFEERAPRAVAQPTRTDHYWMHGRADLGIKWREGRLEIKGLVADEGVARFGEDTAGRVERWVKWGLPSSTEGGLGPPASVPDALRRASVGDTVAPGDPSTTAEWVPVTKRRRLAIFVPTVGGGLECRSPEQRYDVGCLVELTALRVADDPCWSLAFEAFPNDDTVAARLRGVARHVVSAAPPCRLGAAASCGYPEWLRACADRSTA